MNEKHINSTDDLIKNHTIDTGISDKVKIQIGDLAVNKLAPFKNKSNSYADGWILFSAIEFLLKNKGNKIKPIFISNNYTDFCENGNQHEFHSELKSYTEQVNLRFERNLAKALELSPELIAENTEMNEYFLMESLIKNWVEENFGFNTVEQNVRLKALNSDRNIEVDIVGFSSEGKKAVFEVKLNKNILEAIKYGIKTIQKQRDFIENIETWYLVVLGQNFNVPYNLRIELIQNNITLIQGDIIDNKFTTREASL